MRGSVWDLGKINLVAMLRRRYGGEEITGERGDHIFLGNNNLLCGLVPVSERKPYDGICTRYI